MGEKPRPPAPENTMHWRCGGPKRKPEPPPSIYFTEDGVVPFRKRFGFLFFGPAWGVVWLLLKAFFIVTFHFALAGLALARDVLIIAACGRLLGLW